MDEVQLELPLPFPRFLAGEGKRRRTALGAEPLSRFQPGLDSRRHERPVLRG